MKTRFSTPIDNITSIADLTDNELKTLVPDIAQGVNIFSHKYFNDAILLGKHVLLKLCKEIYSGSGYSISSCPIRKSNLEIDYLISPTKSLNSGSKSPIKTAS